MLRLASPGGSAPLSELQLAEAELRAREQEVAARREVRRLRAARQKLTKSDSGRQDQRSYRLQRRQLEAELEERETIARNLEEKLRSFGSRVERPSSTDSFGKDQSLVWQSRIAALTDDLKQKAEKVAVLRSREQQLEAELRSRQHADAPLLPGLKAATAELRDALQSLALSNEAVAKKLFTKSPSFTERRDDEVPEKRLLSYGSTDRIRSESPAASCMLTTEDDRVAQPVGSAVIQDAVQGPSQYQLLTPESVNTLEPSPTNRLRSADAEVVKGSSAQVPVVAVSSATASALNSTSLPKPSPVASPKLPQSWLAGSTAVGHRGGPASISVSSASTEQAVAGRLAVASGIQTFHSGLTMNSHVRPRALPADSPHGQMLQRYPRSVTPPASLSAPARAPAFPSQFGAPLQGFQYRAIPSMGYATPVAVSPRMVAGRPQDAVMIPVANRMQRSLTPPARLPR